VEEKEILQVSVPVGCYVSPLPTGMETSTTLLRKPKRSHESTYKYMYIVGNYIDFQ
jgi:hypothetical protein